MGEVEEYKKDPLYSEYDHVKVALGWLVRNDQTVFNSYKKLVESTGVKSFEIMELWGKYCDKLERDGVKDFNIYINEFLGKEAYSMTKQKKSNNVIPLHTKTYEALKWEEERKQNPMEETRDPEAEKRIRAKLRLLNEKFSPKKSTTS